MSTDPTPLDLLRREIDEIDTSIHDLIMRRAQLAQRIRAAKGPGAPHLRPGREAEVVRNLVARHSGEIPKSVLVKIWREIISVFIHLQGPLAVAAFAPERGPSLEGLAREHFSVLTSINGYVSSTSVLRALTEGDSTIGVLPLPESDSCESWWPKLARSGDMTPRVIARLPFAAASPQETEVPEALVVSLVRQEASGHDRSYLVMEASEPLSQSAVRSLLELAGFEVRSLQFSDEGLDRRFYLAEVEGFVDDEEPRLGRLMAVGADTLRQVWCIGSYAVPLSTEELAESMAAVPGEARKIARYQDIQ